MGFECPVSSKILLTYSFSFFFLYLVAKCIIQQVYVLIKIKFFFLIDFINISFKIIKIFKEI